MANNLIDYFEQKRPRTYSTEWHSRWLCLLLQRAYEERKNVIIEMPPRSGKSELCNVYAPAWWLETHVEHSFGLVCSEDGLAGKFVSATRKLLPHAVEIDRTNEFKIRGTRSLDLTYTGRGIHSNLSGRGFHALVIDDALKSGADAMSDVIRDRLWVDIVSAAINRLSPDGIVIALQARLHTQDVIGKLLDTGMKFLRLHLPATNDTGEAAWFEDGYSGERTVFPPYKYLTKRYPRAKLDEIRATVSEYYWMAQYAQEPSLGALAFFKTDALPRYDRPDVVRVWTAWDIANTATKSGSYSAGVALGLTSDNRLAVLDVVRGKWPQDEVELRIRNQVERLSRLTGIVPEAVIIERAAAGYGIIDRLGGQLPIVPLIPKGSKEDRAAAVCSIVNRGGLLFPAAASYLSAFLDELSSFPLGRSADQVDALVHALSYVARPSEFAPVHEEGVLVYDAIEEHLHQLNNGISPELDAFEGPLYGLLPDRGEDW